MMKDTRLLIRLKEYVNYASTAESNLAHYITEDPQAVIGKSIHELARLLRVPVRIKQTTVHAWHQPGSAVPLCSEVPGDSTPAPTRAYSHGISFRKSQCRPIIIRYL